MKKIQAYNCGILDLLKVENEEIMSQANPGRCAARGVIFVEKEQSGWQFSYRQNRDSNLAPVFNVGDASKQEIVALMAAVAVRIRAIDRKYPNNTDTAEDYKWSCNSSFGPITVPVLKSLINKHWPNSLFPDAWNKIISADVTAIDMASLTLEEKSDLLKKAQSALAEKLVDRHDSIVELIFSKEEISSIDSSVPFCWNFWALTQCESIGNFHRHTYNNYTVKDGIVFTWENRSVKTTSKGWYSKNYPIRYYD